MNKILKALERMCCATLEEDLSVRDIYENEYYIVEQALQRLEAIDNANPSEALGELEVLKEMLNEFVKHTLVDKAFDTIKQALLKQQELPEPFKTGVDIGVIKPKQYLKWDDIEFSYGIKTQKVRMGETIYKISCMRFDNTKEVQLLSEDEKLLYFVFVGKEKDNVQLFNDLHLERVE